MAVVGMGLTARTEVSIMANGTFVADAINVRLIAFAIAQWTIAVNADVARLRNCGHIKWFVHWHEAMLVA